MLVCSEQNNKGNVYDEHKDALIGASVILKGTSQGTITDIDGNFSVEASDKNTVFDCFLYRL